MSNSRKKRDRQFARADALWKQLMGKYEVLRQYKTLEVGVKSKLIAEIHNSELFAENSVYIIELVLQRYTSNRKYLKNALKFKKRYNLANEEVCSITKKDLAYYDRALKDHNKRKVVNAKRSADESKDKAARMSKDRPLIKLKRSV